MPCTGRLLREYFAEIKAAGARAKPRFSWTTKPALARVFDTQAQADAYIEKVLQRLPCSSFESSQGWVIYDPTGKKLLSDYSQVEAANDPNIGRSWLSLNGKRTVDAITSVGGEPRYAVSTEGNPFQDLIKPADLEFEVSLDGKRIDSKQASDIANEKAAGITANNNSLDGFERSLSPLQRPRAVQALCERGIKVNGRVFNKIRDAIRELVKQGYYIDHNKNGRILKAPDANRHFVEKDFTKFGLDYAEYLIQRG